jgi:prophage antirepressor-like protein
MNNLIPAEFNGTSLSVVDHQGRKWLTADQVGNCLGYSSGHEKKAIFKLYERHGDEFTEQDTCIVKLGVSGQNRATRIFSDTGCIKLGFFAATPRASEFRTWASKVLAARQTGVDVAVLDLARENGQLKDQVRARDMIISAKNDAIMGLQDRLIGSQHGQIRLLGRIAGMEKRQRDRETIQLIERMESEGKPREEISVVTGKPLNYIRQRIFIARNEGRLSKVEGGVQ